MAGSYNWPGYGEIKKGDRFKIKITGIMGIHEAEVVDFDDVRGGAPILQSKQYVLGNTDEPIKLKSGDYILQERIQ